MTKNSNDDEEAASSNMLTLENLKKLSELTENDMVLIYTHEGVKAITSQLFGAAVSPTTLYERFAKGISTVFNTEKVSTSNKVQRYLLGDTSNETYMELDKANVIWYESDSPFQGYPSSEYSAVSGFSVQNTFLPDMSIYCST